MAISSSQTICINAKGKCYAHNGHHRSMEGRDLDHLTNQNLTPLFTIMVNDKAAPTLNMHLPLLRVMKSIKANDPNSIDIKPFHKELLQHLNGNRVEALKCCVLALCGYFSNVDDQTYMGYRTDFAGGSKCPADVLAAFMSCLFNWHQAIYGKEIFNFNKVLSELFEEAPEPVSSKIFKVSANLIKVLGQSDCYSESLIELSKIDWFETEGYQEHRRRMLKAIFVQLSNAGRKPCSAPADTKFLLV